MQLEDLKLWHWMLAGIVAGFLFSAVHAWQGPWFDTESLDTPEQGEFENHAIATTKFGRLPWREEALVEKYHAGKPMLKDVVVHPPSARDASGFTWVTGKEYQVSEHPKDPTKPGSPMVVEEKWAPFKYSAKTPYEPGFTLVYTKPINGIRDSAVTAAEKQTLINVFADSKATWKDRRDAIAKSHASAVEKQNLDKVDNEVRALLTLKTAMGGQSEFATVGDYLAAISKLENAGFKYHVAWWEQPKFLWSLPPLAGLLMIGIAWPLGLSTMQNWGMAKAPSGPKPKLAPKPVPVVPMPSPRSTAGVVFKPVVPASQKDPVDTKKYGGQYYPVVKSTTKE